MKKNISLLLSIILLAVSTAFGQTIPKELIGDYGESTPGPHFVKSTISGYAEHEPYSHPDPTGAYFLTGSLDFKFCEADTLLNMARIRYDTYATRKCEEPEEPPYGCNDCPVPQIKCQVHNPHSFGPMSQSIVWSPEYHTYIDIYTMWEEEEPIYFEALTLFLRGEPIPYAVLHEGTFIIDKDGNYQINADLTVLEKSLGYTTYTRYYIDAFDGEYTYPARRRPGLIRMDGSR